jgi:hypothetical protein
VRAADAMAAAEGFGFRPEPLPGLMRDTAGRIRKAIDLARESAEAADPAQLDHLATAALFAAALRMAPSAHAAEMRRDVDTLAGSLGHLISGGPFDAAEFVLTLLDGRSGAPDEVATLTAIAAVCRVVDDAGCLADLLEPLRPKAAGALA